MSELRVTTTEMHTGGEPLRILETGLPEIHGATLLDKIRYIRSHLDHYRRLVIYEPRGHYDMYGVILVEPNSPGADIACVFIHNEGYSTMCGHAVIALGRYAIDRGIVRSPMSPETRLVVQCPCGPVDAFVEYADGKTGDVRFQSVPAYIYARDVTVEVPIHGTVKVDICYGGAFYAFLPAQTLGLDVATSAIQELATAAHRVTEALRKSLTLHHPDSADLAFLYGTILTDGADQDPGPVSAHVCVFADKEVDRSPCGSGVTARVAQLVDRGHLQLGQSRTFRGPSGATFTAKPVREVKVGSRDAVIVEVKGRGHYTGSCTFTMESDDAIGKGFLLR